MILEKRTNFDFSRLLFLGCWGLGTILGPLSTPHVHRCVHPGYALPSQNQGPRLAVPCSLPGPTRGATMPQRRRNRALSNGIAGVFFADVSRKTLIFHEYRTETKDNKCGSRPIPAKEFTRHGGQKRKGKSVRLASPPGTPPQALRGQQETEPY